MTEMEESKLLDIEFKTTVIRLLKNLLKEETKMAAQGRHPNAAYHNKFEFRTETVSYTHLTLPTTTRV